MSNPQSQGSQGPGQPQQQQAPQLLKAEDIARLQSLSDDMKQKYRPVMQNFWLMVQTKPAGSPEHNQARAKLQEWSTKLIAQERQYRQKVKQQAAQSSQTQQSPQNQPPPQASQTANEQQQQGQPAQIQKPQPAPQPSVQSAQQGNRPQSAAQNPNQIDPQVQEHVNQFPFLLPVDGPKMGSQEAQLKIQELKNTYTVMLTRQHKAAFQLKKIQTMIEARQKAGQGVPPEVLNQQQQVQAAYTAAKKVVEEFRQSQAQWKKDHEQRRQQQQQQQQQGASAQQQQPPQQQQAQPQPQQSKQPQPQPQAQQPSQSAVKQEPQIKVEGGQAPSQMQQFSGQQNAQASAPSGAQQPRPPPAPHSQQAQQPNQAGSFGQGAQQQGQQPPRPQINPQQANAHMQQQNHSPHPQSATSNPAGPPVPLSHQAAVSAAQRSYSTQEAQRTGTPMQPGQANFHAPGSREREQLNNPKMPIPRQLNVAQPTPVPMGQARPTMSGPTNGAPGPMGQPVISKVPPFQLEGEGDRVLSKRKLDELVRQVTGGSEEALTPEVEETMLQLADEFVDTVIGSACKLAKLRESPNLEIRDLQLVLERNYNIRIPGYASDEVRTVRKVVPAPGWTQKMNAVQAAKVMGGGKTDM